MDVSYSRGLGILPSPQATFSSIPLPGCRAVCSQLGKWEGFRELSAPQLGQRLSPDPCPPAQHLCWLPEDLVFIYFALVTVGVEITSSVWESTRL